MELTREAPDKLSNISEIGPSITTDSSQCDRLEDMSIAALVTIAATHRFDRTARKRPYPHARPADCLRRDTDDTVDIDCRKFACRAAALVQRRLRLQRCEPGACRQHLKMEIASSRVNKQAAHAGSL